MLKIVFCLITIFCIFTFVACENNSSLESDSLILPTSDEDRILIDSLQKLVETEVQNNELKETILKKLKTKYEYDDIKILEVIYYYPVAEFSDSKGNSEIQIDYSSVNVNVAVGDSSIGVINYWTVYYDTLGRELWEVKRD